MSGQHGDRIVEGHEFFSDACHERVSISKRKVPPPDTFTKEDVSADNRLLIEEVKAQAAWAVARTVRSTSTLEVRSSDTKPVMPHTVLRKASRSRSTGPVPGNAGRDNQSGPAAGGGSAGDSV